MSGKTLTGSLNTTEIGGKGLVLQSVYANNAPVSATGAFTTQVSSQGAQLLFVTDSDSKLRAVTISIPGTPLLVDATSTATTLIFLTLGILAIDPATAKTRIGQLQSIPSFAALVAFLRQNLRTISLNDLNSNSTLDLLLSTCINDWATQFAPTRSRDDSSNINAGFQATLNKDNTVTLANYRFRYLSVVRQELDVSGVQVGNPVNVQILNGPEPLEFSNLIDNLLLSREPFQVKDNPNLGSNSKVALLVYWALGPGEGLINSAIAPFDVSTFNQLGLTYNGLLLKTSITYFVLPYLGVVAGRFPKSTIANFTDYLFTFLMSSSDSANAIIAALAQDDLIATLTAFKTFIFNFSGLLKKQIENTGGIEKFAAAMGISSSAAEEIFTKLTLMEVFFSLKNLSQLVVDLLFSPYLTSVRVQLLPNLLAIFGNTSPPSFAVVDPTTGMATPKSATVDGGGVSAYDPVRQLFYFASNYSGPRGNRLTIIDAKTGTRINQLPIAYVPIALEWDPTSSTLLAIIYGDVPGPPHFAVIDPTTGMATPKSATIDGGGVSAYDPTHQVFYFASNYSGPGGNHLTVINAQSGNLITQLPIAYVPIALVSQ